MRFIYTNFLSSTSGHQVEEVQIVFKTLTIQTYMRRVYIQNMSSILRLSGHLIFTALFNISSKI